MDAAVTRTQSPESSVAPIDSSQWSGECPAAHISVRRRAPPAPLRAAPPPYTLPQDSNRAAPGCASCAPPHRTIFPLLPTSPPSAPAPRPGRTYNRDVFVQLRGPPHVRQRLHRVII